MKKIILIVFLIIVLAAGYWFAKQKTESVATMTDHCSDLKETIFTSLEKGEAGRGGSMGHYTIRFWGDNRFTWNYSDYSESGSYTCKDNIIEVKLPERLAVSATYNPDTKTFIWNEFTYQLTGPIPVR